MPVAKVPTPFKLDCKNVNRQKLDEWFGITTNYCEQSEAYVKFLPGGTNALWIAECRNLTRGLVVQPQIPQGAEQAERDRLTAEATAQTAKIRRELSAMLTTVASYCPEGMFRTVVTEAVSMDWIYKRVTQACNVQATGQYLPAPFMMEWNRDQDTPAIFFMKMKSAFAEALQPAGALYHGEALAQPEAFTPLAESLIVLRWLQAINPALPMHIQESRGSLFKNATPTFADVQPELCDLMETLLTEIETKDTASRLQTQEGTVSNHRVMTNAYSQARWGNGGRGRGGFGQNRRGAPPSNSFQAQDRRASPHTEFQATKKMSCDNCRYTNKKAEEIWASHNINDCFDLYPEKRTNRGGNRVRFLQVPVHVDDNDSFDMSEAANYLEMYQSQSYGYEEDCEDGSHRA